MPFKAIIEIGPISDYLYATRKARDLWGASFLFSYLMGNVARAVLESEKPKKITETIKRPAIENDELFQAIQSGNTDFSNVKAGTIPDRLYCEIGSVDTLTKAKKRFEDVILDLYKRARDDIAGYFGDNFEDKDTNSDTAKKQLLDFFRLFYVYGDSTKLDFDDLEKAALSRSRISEYEKRLDETNAVKDKFHRCQLCGDRKRVIALKDVRPGKKHSEESLCAICTLKRGLRDFVIKGESKKFPSTTDIGSTVIKKAIEHHFDSLRQSLIAFFKFQLVGDPANTGVHVDLKRNLIDEFTWGKYSDFKSKVEKNYFDDKNFSEFEPYIEFRNYFSDHKNAKELRNELRRLYDEQIKQNKGNKALSQLKQTRVWLDRPFVAMVYLDGDGMGSALRELARKNELELMGKISKALSGFANSVAEKIKKFDGQLIYAGGEDVLFMVHPAYLIDVVKQIADFYDQKVAEPFTEQLNQIFTNPVRLTLSGGAYICFHKHPLKLAIAGVQRMEKIAKSQPGKNALAIQLHKGSGERAEVTLPILKDKSTPSFHLQKYNDYLDQVYQETLNIPRGFVYKLSEEYQVMQSVIKGQQDLMNYVSFLLEKSRNGKKTNIEELRPLLEYSFHCDHHGINYQALIHRLYFLRFLTEGD
ncbi:MAG: type III-B CRISPR-associated protein Cas10/Cmr2 [bacterium]